MKTYKIEKGNKKDRFDVIFSENGQPFETHCNRTKKQCERIGEKYLKS